MDVKINFTFLLLYMLSEDIFPFIPMNPPLSDFSSVYKYSENSSRCLFLWTPEAQWSPEAHGAELDHVPEGKNNRLTHGVITHFPTTKPLLAVFTACPFHFPPRSMFSKFIKIHISVALDLQNFLKAPTFKPLTLHPMLIKENENSH